MTINVTNQAPAANADSFTINEDQVLSAENLLANDTDGDGDPLGTALVSDPTNGDLVLHSDGTFIYTPHVNYVGTDSFTYKTTDSIVSTSSQTVSITVQSGGPFDLDGRDASTLTPWMSEPDEATYGLGVSVGHPATITPRVNYVPPDWTMITSRKITFNPSILSVGGNTTGSLTLATSGGNEYVPVEAVVTGYESTVITYEVWGVGTSGGEPTQFVTMRQMQVKEQKAPLVSIDFTSDHGLLHENLLTDDTTKGATQALIKSPEWVRDKENSPISQTRHTADKESKVKLTLNFTVAGDLGGKEVEIEGTSAENALKFKSAAPFNLPAAGGAVPPQALVATNNIGGDIRVINASITWKLNVTGRNVPVELGKSESHQIFVTYGTPQVKADGVKDATLTPTPARMARAVKAFATAQEKARLNAGVNDPKPQRIVYEAVQLHKFDGTSKKLKPEEYAWKVYDHWMNAMATGDDCITGAAFVTYAALMVGMPGTVAAKAYAPESAAKPDKAWEYIPGHASRTRTVGMVVQKLGLDGGSYNAFEGTVVYKVGGKEFYFPVGPNMKRSLDSADKVLRVFTQAAWYTTDKNQTLVEGVNPAYAPLAAADFYDVD